MTDLKQKPCDFGRCQRAGDCDCRICGWHVWDRPHQLNASGQVILDGTSCVNGRPRADGYQG